MVFKLSDQVRLSESNFGYKIVPAKKETGPYAGANSLDEILALQAAELAALTGTKSATPSVSRPGSKAGKRKRYRPARRFGR